MMTNTNLTESEILSVQQLFKCPCWDCSRSTLFREDVIDEDIIRFSCSHANHTYTQYAILLKEQDWINSGKSNCADYNE